MSTSMQAGSVSLDIGKLKALNADVAKYKNHRINVGLFAGTAPHTRTGLSYAEAGAVNEFGSMTKNIPERSFLRVPLMNYLPDAIKATGSAAWKKSLLVDGMLKTLTRLAILARNVVWDAYATRGFGMWAPNAKRTIRRKKSDAPLIETGDTRQAVTYRIVKP